VFYPFEALLRYSALLLRNTRNPQPDDLLTSIKEKERISPSFDESPVIVKKDGKEKE
jgi:hypothetical protein